MSAIKDACDLNEDVIKVKIKSPLECSKEEIQVFEKLTLKGGQVQSYGLRQRINKAFKLIFIFSESQCVAIGAIKRPLSSYKKDVFDKANVTNLNDNFLYELGYFFSIRKRTGRLLMEAAKSVLGSTSCFATTGENNEIMKYLLNEYGFKQIGEQFINENSGNSLRLFVFEV